MESTTWSPASRARRFIEVGVGLPLYLRRTYQGAFLEPGLIVRSRTDERCDGGHDEYCEEHDATVGPQVLAGWHWSWDSGFNLAVAAGIGRDVNTGSDDDYSSGEEEIFGNGYVRFGYAF